MSLTARHDPAREVLDRIIAHVHLDVTFTATSTPYHMGIQQERREIRNLINLVINDPARSLR